MRDGFIQADYITLTGNEYINTGFAVSGKSRILLDCMQLDTSATFAFYCGARTAISATNKTANTLFYVSNTYRQDFYGTSKSTSGYYSTANKRLIIDNNMGTVKIGSDYTLSMTASSTTSVGPLILGASYAYTNSAINSLANYAKLRIYSCKIYDNGTLVRDLVPCSEESSGHIGLYDNVNDMFYRPFGTGNPVLKIEKPIIGSININSAYKSINNGYININGLYKPISQAYIFRNEEYTKLDYIQSNGNQYINTNIIPTGNTKISIDFQMVNQSTNQQGIIGSRNGANSRLTLFTGKSTSALQADYSTYGTLAKETENISSLNLNNRNTIELSNALVINGTKIKEVSATTFANTAYPLYLFANNNTGSVQLPATMKLYSCKIYKNNILVRDYIPVKRNLDNMIGLFESCENKFYCSDFSTKDKIPYSKRSCIETTYASSDHNTNAKWVSNNTTNYAANAKIFMAPDGELNGIAEILEAFSASDAYKFAKYNYDYGYAKPYTNLKSSDCTLVSIKVTNSSGTAISSSNPVMFVDDNHRMHFTIASTALASAAAGNYTLTVTVSRSSISCRFDIPITKIDIASRYFTAGSSSSTIYKNSLVKMCDTRTITCKSFTAEVLVPTWTITSKAPGASYGFNLASDGYYTSSNAGVADSASVCRVNFTNNTGAAYNVKFNCINYAETTYDYGIIGKINTALSASNVSDSTYTKSFSGSQSSSVQTVTLSVPTGTSWVDVKYRKDSSIDKNNDSLKFKITT